MGRTTIATYGDGAFYPHEPCDFSEGATVTLIEKKPTKAEAYIPTMVNRIVEGFQLLRVLLFGSHARGNAAEWSNVDLLVVLSEAPNKRRATVDIMTVLADMPVGKDIIVTTPDEIAKRGHIFGNIVHAALREGQVLYEDHEDAAQEARRWMRFAWEDLDVAQKSLSERSSAPRHA